MKEFKTIEEQKKHLIESKNIKEENKIMSALKERTYVSIINSSKMFFVKNKNNDKHEYIEETTIDDYIALSCYDDIISNKLHLIIGSFEKRLKNSLSYEYSKFLNDNGDVNCISYVEKIKELLLDINNQNSLDELGFKDMNKKYTQRTNVFTARMSTVNYRKEFLSRVIYVGEGVNRPKTRIVEHYQNKNNIVPFWLMVHEFSMGELIEFIELLDMPLRNKIYENFHGKLDPFLVNRFFANALKIKDLRNVISHHEPVIPYVNTIHEDVLRKIVSILNDNYEKSIFTLSNSAINKELIKKNALNEELILKTEIISEII